MTFTRLPGRLSWHRLAEGELLVDSAINRDGVAAALSAARTHWGSVDHVLADGNLVAVHYLTKFKPEDRGFMVVDIFRVAHDKIVEHWDVVQPVPAKSANDNGMF